VEPAEPDLPAVPEPDLPAVRLVLRPIGAPLTLGMSGLGIASVLQSGLDLSWFPPSEAAQTGLILLAVPSVLQLLACVLSYLARDAASGAALGVLATTWLAVGLVHLTSGAVTSGVEGVLLASAALALCASGSTVCRTNPLAGAAFLLAAARFAVEAVYQLGAPVPWREASGIVGLVMAAVIGYGLLAFELEAQARRSLLPTFRRGRGKLTSATALPPDDGLYVEPGIRSSS
jgi:uncharacterized protein